MSAKLRFERAEEGTTLLRYARGQTGRATKQSFADKCVPDVKKPQR